MDVVKLLTKSCNSNIVLHKEYFTSFNHKMLIHSDSMHLFSVYCTEDKQNSCDDQFFMITDGESQIWDH